MWLIRSEKALQWMRHEAVILRLDYYLCTFFAEVYLLIYCIDFINNVISFFHQYKKD